MMMTWVKMFARRRNANQKEIEDYTRRSIEDKGLQVQSDMMTIWLIKLAWEQKI